MVDATFLEHSVPFSWARRAHGGCVTAGVQLSRGVSLAHCQSGDSTHQLESLEALRRVKENQLTLVRNCQVPIWRPYSELISSTSMSCLGSNCLTCLTLACKLAPDVQALATSLLRLRECCSITPLLEGFESSTGYKIGRLRPQ